jgi:hypothetical protein
VKFLLLVAISASARAFLSGPHACTLPVHHRISFVLRRRLFTSFPLQLSLHD